LVAAWNEAAGIARHVQSVLALRYPDLDFVLCAGGPDGTCEQARLAMSGRGTLLEQAPGEGKQRALRRCLAASTGDIVYLTDADCVLDDQSFERVIARIVDGDPAATGRCCPYPEEIEN